MKLPVLPKARLPVPPISELAAKLPHTQTDIAGTAVGTVETISGNAARLAAVVVRQAGMQSALTNAAPSQLSPASSSTTLASEALLSETSGLARISALHALRSAGTYQSPLEKAHADIQANRQRETVRCIEQIVTQSESKGFDEPFSSLPSFWPAGLPRRAGLPG